MCIAFAGRRERECTGQCRGAGLARDDVLGGEHAHRLLGASVRHGDEPVEAARETIGHAIGDGVPQLSPAIIDRCGPGTCASVPATQDSRTHAASDGSTLTSTVGDGRAGLAEVGDRVAAASAPTPIGITTRPGAAMPSRASASSISKNTVE